MNPPSGSPGSRFRWTKVTPEDHVLKLGQSQFFLRAQAVVIRGIRGKMTFVLSDVVYFISRCGHCGTNPGLGSSVQKRYGRFSRKTTIPLLA